MEQTLIIIKPDGVKRNLVGKILSFFEEKGIKLFALEMCTPEKRHIDAHYEKFVEKPFYQRILKFMKSGPVVTCILQGYNVIANVRKYIGATNPIEAEKGTIREMYASCMEENVIHASENKEEFMKEFNIWFD
jgi:nucleoside-diphosphate kinase